MGRLMISSSQMCISREQEEFLAAYRTDEARQAFIDSYGKEKVNFLDGGYQHEFIYNPPVFLPYDNVIEYIEFNGEAGNAYLDLNFILENNYYDIEADFELLGYGSGRYAIWFGFFSGGDVFSLEVNRSGISNNLSQIVLTRWIDNLTNSFSTVLGQRYNIKIYHDGHGFVNDVPLDIFMGEPTVDNTENNFLVFYSVQNNSYTYGRIRNLRVYKEGVLIHNFFAVLKDGLPYMYDNIGNIFSTTVGDGKMIAGPILD